MAELRALRDLIDDDDEAADRAQAAERALFDPSKEAQLARRYEAAAERALFRALREFRQIEARNEPNAPPAPAAPPPAIRPEPRPRPVAAPAPIPVAQASPPVAAPSPTPRPMPPRTNPMNALRAASLRGLG
ncbi:hypothetical protein TA3x_001948 [Tundrisphaera sp. TA3]|uniref:hypothetical protein n=1 Tax=Tundrisphaera sp. TA3 TaxID=3435775 RepID=UPI003EBE8051